MKMYKGQNTKWKHLNFLDEIWKWKMQFLLKICDLNKVVKKYLKIQFFDTSLQFNKLGNMRRAKRFVHEVSDLHEKSL